MDYYQGVVADYLTADRAFFVKPECLIRLSPAGPLLKSQHWYCDVLAVSFREPCAVSSGKGAIRGPLVIAPVASVEFRKSLVV